MKLSIKPILLAATMFMSMGEVLAGSTVYPATQCDEYAATEAGRSHSGYFTNSKTNSVYVACPIPINGGESYPNEGMVLNVISTVVDKSINENIFCRNAMISVNSSGTLNSFYGATKYTSGYGTHRQKLSTGNMPNRSDGAAVVYCKIPKQDPVSAGKSIFYNYTVIDM